MDQDKDRPFCMNRRSAITVMSGGVMAASFAPGDVVEAAEGEARLEDGVYPELKIGTLSRIEVGEPLAFAYPLKQQPNFLVRLGAEALRGVGPDGDIVAFSALCTHMGGSLRGRYRHDVKAVGPCPFHFSTFDLRKGGIPVHASATQNLPQVVLRVDGDDIVAVGVIGLIYGYRSNLADGDIADGATPGRPGGPVIMRG